MKTVFALILSALVCILLLQGCSSPNSDEPHITNDTPYTEDTPDPLCPCAPHEFMRPIHNNPIITDIELVVTQTYNDGYVSLSWSVANNSGRHVITNGFSNIFVYCTVCGQYRMVYGPRDVFDTRQDVYPGTTVMFGQNWRVPYASARYKIVVHEFSVCFADIEARFMEKWTEEVGEREATRLAARMRLIRTDLAYWEEDISDCPLARELFEWVAPHVLVATVCI